MQTSKLFSRNVSGLVLFLFLLSSTAYGAIDVHQFDTESQRQRYHVLVEELRCPKCQNQNLAGSNSQIATDLRRELYRLLKEGKTDSEIKEFMVARYGDFVLYSPPLKSSTLMLWMFPLVLILIGMFVIFTILRKNRQLAASLASDKQNLSSEEQSKLNELLDADADIDSKREQSSTAQPLTEKKETPSK